MLTAAMLGAVRVYARPIVLTLAVASFGVGLASVRPGPIQAQGLSAGGLAGVVRDSAGRPVGNGTVTLTNLRTGRQHFLRIGRDGRYSSGFLLPGRYDALFERLGFIPESVEGVVIPPGQRISLNALLAPAEGEVVTRVVRRAGAVALAGSETPPLDWLTAREASALPADGLGLGAVGLLSSRVGPQLDIEGLPASLTGFMIDGVPAAARPSEAGVLARNVGFALSDFDFVDLVTHAMDVELAGGAGSYISALTRQGPRVLGGNLFGDWAGDAVAASADVAPFQSFRVGGQVGGPIVPDTAHFMIGGEFLRSEMPFESLWQIDPLTAQLVTAAIERFDVDLNRYARPTTGRIERISGFGRLDLVLGGRHDLSVRGSAAILPRLDPILPRSGLFFGPGTSPETRDFFTSATLSSRIDDQLSNELNLGFELSRYSREADPTDAAALDLPATTVAAAGHGFGWADGLVSRSELIEFHARNALHVVTRDHRVKFGIAASYPAYKISFERGLAGEFFFPTTEDFLQRRGSFRGVSGAAPPADFSLRSYSLFAQDTWTPHPGVELTAGLRYAFTVMPDTTGIRADVTWADLSGIGNTSLAGTRRPGRFEPRFGLSWAPDGGRNWRLEFGAVVDGMAIAPEIIGEVFSNAGYVTSFTGVGDLGSWPARPDTTAAPRAGNTLSLLGPDFRGPQSARLSASISRYIDGVAGVTISGIMRRTDFLPRRRDINLLPTPVSFDQHGRPVHGELVKVGGVVAASPGTNRRLIEYDRVWVVEASGQSTYRAFDVALRRPFAAGLALHAGYTYSETEDNWLLGNGRHLESQLTPFPDGFDDVDWADGRSDLDVPHRLVFGAEIKVPGQYGPRLGGLYRYQSGYPFTPGFRDGVDVNGDGSARNDPAFIDQSIAGMDQLLASAPCLLEQVGRFAERNSCRAPGVHALDARLTVDVVRSGRYAAQLVLDGLNLVASRTGEVDRAVYLVDPDASLGGNQPFGTVGVPLVVNPDFGQLRTRYSPLRTVRLGLRVSY